MVSPNDNSRSAMNLWFFLELNLRVSAAFANTVELQWLEHLSNHENMFETRVDRANEC